MQLIEDIHVVFYKYGFFFIKWYENEYLISGVGHEWYMITFIPEDGKNPAFIEKNLNVLYTIHFSPFLYYKMKTRK
jgi:hypothetical protein